MVLAAGATQPPRGRLPQSRSYLRPISRHRLKGPPQCPSRPNSGPRLKGTILTEDQMMLLLTAVHLLVAFLTFVKSK